jgi:hypothetical protein
VPAVAPAPPVLRGLAVAPPVLAVAPPVLAVPSAAPDSFADPAVLGETPVPDPPVLLPDPAEADAPAGGLLGVSVGDVLADDDGLCSLEGDAFGEAE